MIFLNIFHRDGRKLRGKILSGMAPSTAFQQQIKDFKPKVISPGANKVSLRENEETASQPSLFSP